MKDKIKIIIEPNKPIARYWKEIWSYRELFLFLTWKDFLVRYKQTILGIGWSIIRPFLSMVVLSIIFGKIGKLPSNGVPYPILVYAALLPWQFFSNTLSESSNSLLANVNLLTKVYFPRIILPSTSIIVSILDFFLSFSIFIFIMIYYHYVPSLKIVTIPIFLLMAILSALGPSYLISSLNVQFRDFRYIVPFIVQFGLYISPVGFSSSLVPLKWKFLYSLNPMVGVIDGFRWAILKEYSDFNFTTTALSLLVSIVFLLIGLKVFRTMERKFADIA